MRSYLPLNLEKLLKPTSVNMHLQILTAPPGWLSGERVGLMIWWLRVRSPVEATFLSGVISPLTSAEACEKSSRWLWKEMYWCEKASNHMCVTDCHDMTLAVKVALNPNTTNQQILTNHHQTWSKCM